MCNKRIAVNNWILMVRRVTLLDHDSFTVISQCLLNFSSLLTYRFSICTTRTGTHRDMAVRSVRMVNSTSLLPAVSSTLLASARRPPCPRPQFRSWPSGGRCRHHQTGERPSPNFQLFLSYQNFPTHTNFQFFHHIVSILTKLLILT